MTFGAQVAQSHRISNKDSIHHKNKSRKSPRFRNDRSMKAKTGHQESTSTVFDSGLSTAVNIPRRRRTDNRSDAAVNIPYAGAKFSSPPPPSVLPKPPSHWISSPIHHFDMDVVAMSQHLRMLLRVESWFDKELWWWKKVKVNTISSVYKRHLSHLRQICRFCTNLYICK